MIHYDIPAIDNRLEESLRSAIDNKTKPVGALGVLESIALKVGLIQNTLSPKLIKPHIVVFAGDHGIARDGVSAYPQEVTHQMVQNFLNGGAAINVFCAQHEIDLLVVDAGVAGDFDSQEGLLDEKIDYGTINFLHDMAMTSGQLEETLLRGKKIVNRLSEVGSNVVGFGEMGIGNTSSASILMSLLCNLDIKDCVGRGTGLDNQQLENKLSILTSALEYHGLDGKNPLEVLQAFGGFEMAMMCGAMLAAAERKMILLVDGFIATSAFLAAYHFNKNILDYAVFCHQSDEQGHGKMLSYLGVEPLLKMDLRLGEGTGCALAYPLIQSSVHFLNKMASFESAGVSNK